MRLLKWRPITTCHVFGMSTLARHYVHYFQVKYGPPFRVTMQKFTEWPLLSVCMSSPFWSIIPEWKVIETPNWQKYLS